MFTAVVALTVDSGWREWDRVLSLLPRQRRSNPNRLMISLGIPLFLQTHCHEMFQSAGKITLVLWVGVMIQPVRRRGGWL